MPGSTGESCCFPQCSARLFSAHAGNVREAAGSCTGSKPSSAQCNPAQPSASQLSPAQASATAHAPLELWEVTHQIHWKMGRAQGNSPVNPCHPAPRRVFASQPSPGLVSTRLCQAQSPAPALHVTTFSSPRLGNWKENIFYGFSCLLSNSTRLFFLPNKNNYLP